MLGKHILKNPFAFGFKGNLWSFVFHDHSILGDFWHQFDCKTLQSANTDTVLDIEPGTGSKTIKMLDRAKKVRVRSSCCKHYGCWSRVHRWWLNSVIKTELPFFHVCVTFVLNQNSSLFVFAQYIDPCKWSKCLLYINLNLKKVPDITVVNTEVSIK